jgi:L,D-transpeptidase catalytic domain/Putative peptidoglycan binding domain
MHRASPTLLVFATCLAGSLLTPSPAAADDTGSPSPDASSSSAASVPSPSETSPSSTSAPSSPTPSPSPSATDESPFDAPPTPFAPSPSAFASPSDTLVTTNVVMAATAPGAQPSVRPPRARLPLRKGHYGLKVARLQDRLTWLGYDIDDSNIERQAYGTSTAAALKSFQVKNWLPVTGKANKRTWKALKRISEPIGILPLRCTEVKMALCIDKTSRTLRLVVKGKVKVITDARFGAPGMETGEGVFTIKEKSYNHTSTLYDTWMPRAMFFNGDEAVHYSPDFASVGYIRGSHGCVGVRDLDVATRLFEKVDVGTRVYVYWS